jgi:hypothetical protein
LGHEFLPGILRAGAAGVNAGAALFCSRYADLSLLAILLLQAKWARLDEDGAPSDFITGVFGAEGLVATSRALAGEQGLARALRRSGLGRCGRGRQRAQNTRATYGCDARVMGRYFACRT